MNPGAYGAPTIESTLEPEAQIGRLPAPKPIFVRASASYGHRASNNSNAPGSPSLPAG
jgi:hypothetical protein